MHLLKKSIIASLCALIASGSALAADSAPKTQSQSTLTAEALSLILIGDIALDRGQSDVAYEAFMRAARQTRHAGLAEKALSVAPQTSNQDASTQALQLLQTLYPQNASARLVYVADLIKKGNWPEALGTLKILLKNSQDPALLIENLLSQLTEVQNTDRLYKLMRSAFGSYSDNAKVQLQLAQLARNAKLNKEAQLHAARACESAKQDLMTFLQAAEIEIAFSPRTTVRRLEKHLKQNPESFQLYFALCRGYMQAKTPEKIKPLVPKMAQLAASQPSYQLTAGMIAEEVKLFGIAEDLYKQYLDAALAANNPHLSKDTAYVRLGMISQAQGKKTQAALWLHKVKEGKQYLAAHIREAELLAELNRIDEACQTLKEIRTDSDRQKMDFRLACANLLLQKNRPADALDAFEDALRIDPKDDQLLYNAAMIADRNGLFLQAESLLRRFIALRPQDCQGYNSLGYMMLEKNIRIDEAAALIEKADALAKGNDPFTTDSLGWLRFKQGRHAEAEALLRKALRQKDDLDMHLHLIEILVAQKKIPAAKTHAQELLKKMPDNASLIQLIQKYNLY